MFGTLIVLLPCPHAGGDLVLRHNGEECNFSTTSKALRGVQWLTFYADVERKLRAVTSGSLGTAPSSYITSSASRVTRRFPRRRPRPRVQC